MSPMHFSAQWGRVPALNTNQAFIDDLADAVVEALPYVGQMVGPSENLVPIGERSRGSALLDQRAALTLPTHA